MSTNNNQVLLTIYLEKGITYEVSTTELKTSDIFGYKLKRPRRVRKIINGKVEKKVLLNEEQVAYFMSFNSRPTRHESPKMYSYWLRMKPKDRLDYHCSVLAESDSAIAYNYEFV